MITISIKDKRKSIREEDMAYIGEQEKRGEERRSWYGGVALLLPGKPPRRWLLLLGDLRAVGGGREQSSHCCWVP